MDLKILEDGPTMAIPPLLSTRPLLTLPLGHLGVQFHQQKPAPAKMKKSIMDGFFDHLQAMHQNIKGYMRIYENITY